jgi:hypothetical protein
MKSVFLDGFKGGIIKSSYDEEWLYEPNGVVTCLQLGAKNPPKDPIKYIWDGEYFTPASDSAVSYGAGQWSGVFIGWYLKGKNCRFLKSHF